MESTAYAKYNLENVTALARIKDEGFHAAFLSILEKKPEPLMYYVDAAGSRALNSFVKEIYLNYKRAAAKRLSAEDMIGGLEDRIVGLVDKHIPVEAYKGETGYHPTYIMLPLPYRRALESDLLLEHR
jgi:hypothetical protein